MDYLTIITGLCIVNVLGIAALLFKVGRYTGIIDTRLDSHEKRIVSLEDSRKESYRAK